MKGLCVGCVCVCSGGEGCMCVCEVVWVEIGCRD